jgi:hypothetical protein
VKALSELRVIKECADMIGASPMMARMRPATHLLQQRFRQHGQGTGNDDDVAWCAPFSQPLAPSVPRSLRHTVGGQVLLSQVFSWNDFRTLVMTCLVRQQNGHA